MAKTLFISDLHLDRTRPEIIRLFVDFLANDAKEADAVYILGDLFEYWIGDDQPVTGLEPVIEGLQALKSITPIFFLHGNRDFLLGETFAETTGIKLLPESIVVDLYGQNALILHGDTLCSDDIEYQKLRLMLRNQDWKNQFLSYPIEQRIQQALELREKSMTETGSKTEKIMDVNQQSVEDLLTQHNVNIMIHGHTHRPAQHEFQLNGKPAQRIVLGDWYKQGSVLTVAANNMQLSSLKTPLEKQAS